ncbi:MAG: hypothetical protein AAF236_11520 [Verrucomicrobiota bacterium]
MPNEKLSLIEVHGDRAVGIRGDSSEKALSLFARDAESFQTRAYLIGSSIGMSAVTGAAAAYDEGTIGFRFANSSNEGFDARGILATDGQYDPISVMSCLELG